MKTDYSQLEIAQIVDGRMLQQMSRYGVLDERLDTRSVDWEQIISQALTRKAPFEIENEKGFRDALILETFFQFASSLCKEQAFFASRDKRMGEAFENRKASRETIRLFRDLSSLRTELGAMDADISSKQIAEILAIAEQYFYIPQDKKTLFIRSKVFEKIQSNKDFLNEINAIPNASIASIGIDKPSFVQEIAGKLQFLTKIKVDIKFTQYQWKTPAQTAPSPAPTGLFGIPPPNYFVDSSGMATPAFLFSTPGSVHTNTSSNLFRGTSTDFSGTTGLMGAFDQLALVEARQSFMFDVLWEAKLMPRKLSSGQVLSLEMQGSARAEADS
jgi:hypothetical protein